MSEDKRASLQAWRDRVGREEAERISKAALLRGRIIDEQVELLHTTGACEDSRISIYLNGYSFVARELPVVSEMHGYQGRLDAILRMNGRNILVDFKGATRWKPKKYLEDYRVQLGAYYGACLESGMNIDCACVILFIDGRRRPQVYWQQLHELNEAHLIFVDRVKRYYEMKAEESLVPESKNTTP